MKNIKFLLLTALILCMSVTLSAQNFGHLNATALLSSMPEYKQAESEMETFSKQKQNLLESKLKVLEAQYAQFLEDQKAGQMSPIVEQQKGKELSLLEQELGQLEQSMQQEISKKQSELLAPIQEKGMNAIKDVAIENGYDYIFDASFGNLLYAPDADDVTELVKAKLGVQ